MSSNYSIEIIPAAAISEAIAGTPALIIDNTGSDHMASVIGKLYSNGQYKTYFTRPGINQLPKTIELANSLGIKTVVLCGEHLPRLKDIFGEKEYSAALISAGSPINSKDTLLRHILKDPLAVEFAHIGYQSYRYSPKDMHLLRERNFEEIRLGVLRDDNTLCEPMLRTKDQIFIDLNAVRCSDFPNNTTFSPNGLYAEEICQIARYAGMGQKVKNIYIYGYPSTLEPNPIAAELTAEVFWHIAEALSSSVDEDPGNSAMEDMFLRKIVSMGEEGQDIVFVTSCSSGRWWMEVSEVKTTNIQYIPCSYQDYLTACSGEIPLRWLFFFQKINPI